MDSAAIVDRSRGIPSSSARWKKLVPRAVSFLGDSRLFVPGRCFTDLQLASKFPCTEMSLLRLNSQGEDEYDIGTRVVLENSDYTDSSKLSSLTSHQNAKGLSNSFNEDSTVSLLQCQRSLSHLASPISNVTRYLHCMADAWSSNSFTDSLSNTSKVNEMSTKLVSAVEPCLSKGFIPNSFSTKLFLPSVASCGAIDLNRQCPCNLEVPMSVIGAEKHRYNRCVSPLISFCTEHNTSISNGDINFLQSHSTGNLVSCSAESSKMMTECLPSKLILNEVVEIHCRQGKLEARKICLGKVRFLCRRKNAYNIRRTMAKFKQSKRIQLSHHCVVESKCTSEFIAIPVSNSHCKVNSSWFARSWSGVSSSCSSLLDEEDEVESSSADIKAYGKNIQSDELDPSSSCDSDDEDFVQFSSSAENDQEDEVLFSDFQLASSLSTYISCQENTSFSEWNTKSPNDLVLTSNLLDYSDEEDEIDGGPIQSNFNLIEINSRWNKLYEFNTQIYPAECCLEKMKKVKFNSETSSVAVLNEVEWAKEYEDARRGSWVQDRLHFDRRIRETEEQISWIFCAEHRRKQFAIYGE